MEWTRFKPYSTDDFRRKALIWANQFPCCSYLDNNRFNGYSDHRWDALLAVDSIESCRENVPHAWKTFEQFYSKKKDRFLFGFFGYDLKNELEKLSSKNPGFINFPDVCFFEPRYLFLFSGDEVLLNRNSLECIYIREQIEQVAQSSTGDIPPIRNLIRSMDEVEYKDAVRRILNHIEQGDIYELNLCVEFRAEHVSLNALDLFRRLNEKNQAPFSAYYKMDGQYILCASPERYLSKKGNLLLSQPIKGTIRRDSNPEKDAQLKKQLAIDEKCRAENVMITDLVRNDLSRSCVAGSVVVNELFKVYSFYKLHHLVSSIQGILRDGISGLDAIRTSFPMGSMTGAPKVRSMQLIDAFENSKRSAFSGALGYFDEHGDFDLNVVIRSIYYDENTKQLSFQAGGAITYDSDPEEEWKEMMLKASSIREVLGIPN